MNDQKVKTGEGFLSICEVERFLSYFPAEMCDIALELRNIVAEVCPLATERILWGALSYHDPSKGGPVKGAICQVGVDKDKVTLGFIHGVRLSDPEHILGGNRLSKRIVSFDSYATVPWRAIRELLVEAAGLDPSEFEAIRKA
jgi:hypothetical protein